MTEIIELKQYKPTKFNNFCQIPNKIYDLSITGTSSTPAAAFQTLGFILRLHPDTVITPKNISKQMEIRATLTGGKYKKPETIRAEFRKLIKADYMFSQLTFDSKGGTMPTQYMLNFDKILGGGGENSPPLKLCNNLQETQTKHDNRWGGENSPGAYNKVRAVYNTGNNTDNPKDCNSIVNEKILTPSRGDFFALVPIELRDKEIWILISSVRKYLKETAYETWLTAFNDPSVKDPIKWLWGAVNKKKPDNQDRQSLTPPQSTADIPANPPEDPPQLNSEEELIEEENKRIEPLYKLSDDDFLILMKRTSAKMSRFEYKRSNIDHYLRERCRRDLILEKAINRKRIIEVLDENTTR